MTNVFSLEVHRSKISQTPFLAKPVSESVEQSNKKLIALIDKRVFTFRKPIVSVEEFDELIARLERQWIKDTQVALKSWILITNSEQAVWQDTFMFSDEASIFIFDLLWILYDYWVTDKWNPLIISK